MFRPAVNDLEEFFAKKLYNSYEATDQLVKNIEKSQDEGLAKKALAMYQQHYSTLLRPWDHVTFIYGLGLIYMHFNAYHWAIKAFREAIYVQPSFPRSRDVHTRLGLIFKATGRYMLSEKHFNLAINDTRPGSGSCTQHELEFQIAHLFEVQGKFKQAKEAYERLLQEKDLPQQLSANIHRQLGWMYVYTDDSVQHQNLSPNNANRRHNATANGRMDTALNFLTTSQRTDSDPRTSYYMGRCFTNIGRYQDAFASYRSVIDREESTADTWCSIGVLYHRQNQTMDAQQAYIRSVQFDKRHTIAWLNLGILYENHQQFDDALKCYQHVLRSSSNGVDKSLLSRVKYIQKQIAEIDSFKSNSTKSKAISNKLLSIEDLWNLESKISSRETANHNNYSRVSMIDRPQSNQGMPDVATITAPTSTDRTLTLPQNIEIPMDTDQITSNEKACTTSEPHKNDNALTNFIGKNELSIKLEPNCDLDASSTANINLKMKSNNHDETLTDCKLELASENLIDQNCDMKGGLSLNQNLINGASKDSGISSSSSTYADGILVPSQNADKIIENYVSAKQVIEIYKNTSRPKKIDVNLLTDDEQPPYIFTRSPPYPPLSADKLFPSPPSVFLETKKDLTTKKVNELCRTSPISIVRNFASVLKLDLGLFSTKTLVETNPDHPVDILSHIFNQSGENVDDLPTNLWAFDCQRSSSTISRFASYQVSSFRESLKEEMQAKSGNSKTNPSKESETDSNESAKRPNSNNISNNAHSQSSLQNDVQLGNHQQPSSSDSKAKGLAKDQSCAKQVKAANRIDLSDEKRWRPQLNELNKMPNFTKCISASNMLTHIGASLAGINTTQMGMHVPGCRILGDPTTNNFCHVNINVGPGDYEWCAISAYYSSCFVKLCNRHGVELGDNWWPQIKDLQKSNVPIYRFSQRPGDMVWVNSGTIYWVQATGWCNNIFWKVGPLCAEQYRSASESTEINKLLFQKTQVPMVQLTWNLVMNISYILDEELCINIIDVLKRSLRYCMLIEDLLVETKTDAQSSGEEPGPKVAACCSLCEFEVFNIRFMDKTNGKLLCVECARRLDPTLNRFEIKQDYELVYLMRLFDNFIEMKRKVDARNQFKGPEIINHSEVQQQD